MPFILVVEDNPADALLLSEALLESGQLLDVTIVPTGEEALAFLRRGSEESRERAPDLVLLDLNLPGRSGSDILREMKEDPALALVPVVVLTTSSSETDIRDCYRAHANCYVQKPLHFDDFIAVVRSITSFWLGFATLPSYA